MRRAETQAKMRNASETDRVAGQRLGEKKQALVHPIIDPRAVIRELLVAMRYAKLVNFLIFLVSRARVRA
jgi:hypothetical protein